MPNGKPIIGYETLPWEVGKHGKEQLDALVQSLHDIKGAGYDAVESLAFTTYNDDFARRRMEFEEWPREVNIASDMDFMSRFATLLRTCQELDLKLTNIFIESEFINPHFAQGEFDQVVTISHLLKSAGANHIVMDGGPRRPGAKHQEDLLALAKVVNKLGRATSDIGIELCFHPHIDTCVETPEDIEIFFNETDPEFVSIALDTAHIRAGGGDPLAFVKANVGRIRYVHFKDIADPESFGDGFHGPTRYDAFKNLGEGTIDFAAIWNVLSAAGYDQPLIIELDGTPDPKASAHISREYLRKTVGL